MRIKIKSLSSKPISTDLGVLQPGQILDQDFTYDEMYMTMQGIFALRDAHLIKIIETEEDKPILTLDAHARLSNMTNQVPINTDPVQVHTNGTLGDLVENIIVDGDDIYLTEHGSYLVNAYGTISRPGGGGAVELDMWLKINDVNVDSAAGHGIMRNPGELDHVTFNYMFEGEVDDKLSVWMQISTTTGSGGLYYQSATVVKPAIPSFAMTVIKCGV